MKPSRYLKKFANLANSAKDTYHLIGDYLLVERIPDEELKTKSGLIIPVTSPHKQIDTITADKPLWVHVLAVGEGYYTQDTDPETGATIEKSVPLDVKPGDIVLVSKVGVKWFSVFGELELYEADSIGLTKEADIQLKFKGQEGYERAFRSLNQTIETQVAGV